MRTDIKRLPKYLMSLAGAPRLSDLPYRAVQLFGRLRYTRYLVASAMALAVDLANFFFLLHLNVPAVRASIFGYISGLAVHWLLSTRLAFADKLRSTTAARRRQQLLFVISALVGLAVTAAVIECGLRLGIAPGVAKLVGIAVSFHVTYLLRRSFIFT